MNSIHNKINWHPYKYVLLTGAGFTHNFGGFLASQMWNEIFNRIDSEKFPRIKNLMQNNFDYESLYQKVIFNDQFSEAEKNAYGKAIFEAYSEMDSIIKYTFMSSSPTFMSNFFDKFFGQGKTKGFFFTLNQDLFIENFFWLRNKEISLPGINSQFYIEALETNNTFSLPLSFEENFESDQQVKLYYVKLHGSQNWGSSLNNKVMVLGLNKTNQINSEPFLKQYFKIFSQVLLSGEIRLISIGYGFKDSHINKIIAQAVIEKKLKLCIINPSSPDEFFNKLEEQENGKEIKIGIERYISKTFKQMLYIPYPLVITKIDELFSF